MSSLTASHTWSILNLCQRNHKFLGVAGFNRLIRICCWFSEWSNDWFSHPEPSPVSNHSGADGGHWVRPLWECDIRCFLKWSAYCDHGLHKCLTEKLKHLCTFRREMIIYSLILKIMFYKWHRIVEVHMCSFKYFIMNCTNIYKIHLYRMLYNTVKSKCLEPGFNKD